MNMIAWLLKQKARGAMNVIEAIRIATMDDFVPTPYEQAEASEVLAKEVDLLRCQLLVCRGEMATKALGPEIFHLLCRVRDSSILVSPEDEKLICQTIESQQVEIKRMRGFVEAMERYVELRSKAGLTLEQCVVNEAEWQKVLRQIARLAMETMGGD